MDLKEIMIGLVFVIMFLFGAIIIANVIDIRMEMVAVRSILEQVEDMPAYQIELNGDDFVAPNEGHSA